MGMIAGGSQNGWYLRLEYSHTQDVSANASTVTTTLSVYDGTGYSQNEDANSAYYLIQGEKRWSPYNYGSTGWYTLGSKTWTVSHNADGTASVTLTGEWDCGFTSSYTPRHLSVSGALTLPTIPRATTPTIGAVTLGSAVTIGLPRASSGFTHDLTYTFGSAGGTIASGADTSVSWTPPLTLANQIPNSTSGTGTITCVTKNGSTTIGTKTISFTASVPASVAPEINSFTVTAEATVFAGKFVKGISRVSYAVTANGNAGDDYGASISKYEFSFGVLAGSASSGTTEIIPIAAESSIEAKIKVTDSRGRASTQTLAAVTVYDYAPPAFEACVAVRCGANGTASSTGAYISAKCKASCSSVGGANTLTRRVRYRATGGGYSGYTALVDNTATIIGGTLSASASYEVEISIVDTAGNTKTVIYSIPTDAVTWNVRDGGKGAALGKYSEKDAFECAMPAEFTGGVKIGAQTLAEYIYPVGSIYLSANAASPATLFGGTWERITDRFLLAAGDVYAAGATGGAAEHTLTEAEMPSTKFIWGYGADGNVNDYLGGSTADYGISPGSGAGTRPFYTNTVGGGQAHSILPPYLAVYVWQRTA